MTNPTHIAVPDQAFSKIPLPSLQTLEISGRTLFIRIGKL